MLTKKVSALLFDGFNAMDIVGPIEVFNVASELGEIDYQVSLIGLEKRAYRSEGTLKTLADETIHNVHDVDILILPGGEGARDPSIQASHLPFMNRMLSCSGRVVSVCTGAYLLASTGALNGKEATTHWQYLDDLQKHFPEIQVVDDVLYIDHGSVATSAGITSGIDLALKIVEQDCGRELAVKVARFLVVHYQRGGNQAQFSDPLHFQAKCGPEFSDLTSWILNNLASELSVSTLAEHMNMSPRTFHRKFTDEMGETPGKYIEQLRLDRARQLLTEKNWPIQTIAECCGYPNVDVFRRAFQRRFSTSAPAYRAQFS